MSKLDKAVTSIVPNGRFQDVKTSVIQQVDLCGECVDTDITFVFTVYGTSNGRFNLDIFRDCIGQGLWYFPAQNLEYGKTYSYHLQVDKSDEKVCGEDYVGEICSLDPYEFPVSCTSRLEFSVKDYDDNNHQKAWNISIAALMPYDCYDDQETGSDLAHLRSISALVTRIMSAFLDLSNTNDRFPRTIPVIDLPNQPQEHYVVQHQEYIYRSVHTPFTRITSTISGFGDDDCEEIGLITINEPETSLKHITIVDGEKRIQSFLHEIARENMEVSCRGKVTTKPVSNKLWGSSSDTTTSSLKGENCDTIGEVYTYLIFPQTPRSFQKKRVRVEVKTVVESHFYYLLFMVALALLFVFNSAFTLFVQCVVLKTPADEFLNCLVPIEDDGKRNVRRKKERIDDVTPRFVKLIVWTSIQITLFSLLFVFANWLGLLCLIGCISLFKGRKSCLKDTPFLHVRQYPSCTKLICGFFSVYTIIVGPSMGLICLVFEATDLCIYIGIYSDRKEVIEKILVRDLGILVDVVVMVVNLPILYRMIVKLGRRESSGVLLEKLKAFLRFICVLVIMMYSSLHIAILSEFSVSGSSEAFWMGLCLRVFVLTFMETVVSLMEGIVDVSENLVGGESEPRNITVMYVENEEEDESEVELFEEELRPLVENVR